MTNTSLDIQQLFANIPAAMALVDSNRVYLAATGKYSTLIQQPICSLPGKSFYDCHNSGHPIWDNIFRDVLSGKDRSDINDPYFQHNNPSIHHRIAAKPWLSSGGEIAGVLISLEEVRINQTESINEDRFKLFMDYFPGLCWISDDQNILKYGNKTFFKTLNISDAVIGKKNEDIFGFDIAQKGHIKNMDVLKGKTESEFYQVIRDKEDNPQYFKTYKFPFYDEQGRCNLVGAISFDITESKQLEEHLYQSDEQFRQAFDHSLIGMAIISPLGKWKQVNASLCQMLGYSESELQSMYMQEVTHPDDLLTSNDFLLQLTQGEKEHIKLEKRYIHKNGSIIWVMLAATMLKDKAGNPIQYVSHLENITQRKEIEDNLILSEKKYRTIFENVQDVFYQTNQAGIVTEISPSIKFYAGYCREEVLGRPVTDFYYYEQDRVRILELLRNEGSVIDFEVRLKTKGGKLKYASVNARLVIEEGKVIATEGSMRDVTTRKFQENALKTLNRELKESNEQKNRLLSVIGHDLRNPISGSLQLLELTLSDYDSTSVGEIHAYLFKIKEELGNANDLLEDLLTWAKAQFNSFNFNPVKTKDLKSLVQNCVHKVLPMALKKGVTITLDIEAQTAITADVAMLETILRNLVSNAVKFTVEGDKVILFARRVNNNIHFAVKDTGTGIPKDMLENLFKENINLTTYGTAGEKGTGLGLNLCRDFVSRHGGEIWVESKIKEGSTFYFTIPQPAVE